MTLRSAVWYVSALCFSVVAIYADRSAIALTPEKIEYRFRLLDRSRIEVSTQFQGSQAGSTILQVASEWGGVKNDGQDVSQLVVTDASDRPLAHRSESPTQWTVSHNANEILRATYVIQPSTDRPYHPGNDYRTHIGDDWFQMIGHLGLLVPNSIQEDSEVNVSIRWIGFREAGWRVACSFGFDQEEMRYSGRWSRFVHSMWMAGKFQWEERSLNGNKIGLAIVGKGWRFSSDQLASVVEQIISAERDFFSDHSDPWYLVTLSPITLKRPGGNSLGGTGLTNCFALYCDTSLTLQKENANDQYDARLRTLILLAHEYFHHWNGGKIPTAGENPETYWFSEGFTTFYARRILYRAKLIDAQQYISDLNESLTNWSQNPNRDAPNARIGTGFWTDRSLQQLPYQRGDRIAYWLDEKIRKRSMNRESIDSLLLDLYQNPPVPPVTSPMILERISRWIDSADYELLRSMVMDGTPVPMPESLSEPNAKLATASFQSFDSGFDMNESQKSRTIVGVDPEGPAYAAGLRNGQTIQKMNISSSPAPKASLTVVENGVTKSIEYDPLSKPSKVSIYKLEKSDK